MKRNTADLCALMGLDCHNPCVKGIKHIPEFYVHYELTSTEKDKRRGRGRTIGDFKICVLYFSVIFKVFKNSSVCITFII